MKKVALLFGAMVEILSIEGNGVKRGHRVHHSLRHRSTGGRGQGRSGTCWSFPATGFLSECIRKGKRVDAGAYVVRVYEAKAHTPALKFGQGGALPDAIFVLKEHGAVPEEIYSGRPDKGQQIDHGELEDASAVGCRFEKGRSL